MWLFTLLCSRCWLADEQKGRGGGGYAQVEGSERVLPIRTSARPPKEDCMLHTWFSVSCMPLCAVERLRDEGSKLYGDGVVMEGRAKMSLCGQVDAA